MFNNTKSIPMDPPNASFHLSNLKHEATQAEHPLYRLLHKPQSPEIIFNDTQISKNSVQQQPLIKTDSYQK